MVMNKHDAEDIVQDAFLKIWNRPHIWKNDNSTKFTTWFYRIVMNIAVDKFRKNSKENSVEIKDNILSDDRSQEQELLFNEEQKFLQGAMLALPEKQLMALNLCFYEGLSNKEAAEVMHINVKALESLLMRGKTKLKDYFHRQGFLKQEDVA
jgi:RNA polymerase sigma-70 factor (ECF subfamily)